MINRFWQISLNGLTPLSFNDPSVRPPKKEKPKNPEEWEEQNWERRLYRNDDGQLIAPVHCLRKTALMGCSFVETRPGIGKLGWRTLADDCMLWASIGVGAKIECDEKKIIQWRDYVNPNPSQARKGGGGVLKIRPLINLPWALGFTIQTTHECFDKTAVEDIFSAAFEIKGLGEGRNYRGYGRARVNVTSIDG